MATGEKGGLDFTFAEYKETKSIQHINHMMRWLIATEEVKP